MNDSHPTLVSVGLPAYNGSKTVERALRSLAAQTYPSIEVIVCDDVSTDNTAEICSRFADNYSWIRFERNSVNLGAHHNMMKTLGLATGEYFIWADQEDYWAPEFIAALVAEFEKDPGVSAVMTGTRVLYEDGTEARTVRLPDVEGPQNRSHLANAISVITKQGGNTTKLQTNLFIHGVMRRREFQRANEVYPGVPQSERQIICQMALSGRLVFVDKMLFVQTAHGIPIEKRRSASDARVVARSKPFRRLRYMFGLGVAVVRNTDIPWHRKAFVPILLVSFFWVRVVKKEAHRFLGILAGRLPVSVHACLKRQWRRMRLNSVDRARPGR